MLDRNYDPEIDGAAGAKIFNFDDLSPPERPLPNSLYADKLGLKEDFIDELEAIDDNGGYGTTHKLLGYKGSVQPSWIWRIMRGQKKDGGWWFERSLFRRGTEQNARCVAVTALILYRENHLRSGLSHARAPKLGAVLSLSRVSRAGAPEQA